MNNSKQFEFDKCSLADLYSIRRIPIEDSRGFFSRFYCAEEFKELGLQQPISQMNYTSTMNKGTIRGLHFQHPPYSETKIVNCLRGKIFDVVVDIRQNSPTFLQWHGEVLSAENMTGIFIPKGFAHGFQSLTDNCELMYLHTDFYTANAEDGLNIKDPAIGIIWPLDVTVCSSRDRDHPMIGDTFTGVAIK